MALPAPPEPFREMTPAEPFLCTAEPSLLAAAPIASADMPAESLLPLLRGLPADTGDGGGAFALERGPSTAEEVPGLRPAPPCRLPPEGSEGLNPASLASRRTAL
jgi:hypothetical protein